MARTPEQIGALRFLVVEDHGFQRWAIAKALESLGAREVLLASDGSEALEALARDGASVDVIVTDLNMPGMDGMAFIRHVGERSCTSALIVASEHDVALIDSVATMAAAYGVRVLAAIPKPLTPGKLAAALADLEAQPRPPAPPAANSFTAEEAIAGISRGEMRAYFQPQVDMADGGVRRAEALIRWCHPSHGIVLPEAFIPALERCGAIDALTTHVVTQAAAACRRWRSHGADVGVSVNISLASLEDVRLSERLAALVEGEELDPRNMTIEVTESLAVASLGKVLENLSRLRMRGFGLAIDDYGIGYSSLQQLARMPFTELKIDRSFVRGAVENNVGLAVLESSLQMADRLRLLTVAEGVEQANEWELLRRLGCRLAQGHFIARAMPPGDFERALQRGDWSGA